MILKITIEKFKSGLRFTDTTLTSGLDGEHVIEMREGSTDGVTEDVDKFHILGIVQFRHSFWNKWTIEIIGSFFVTHFIFENKGHGIVVPKLFIIDDSKIWRVK